MQHFAVSAACQKRQREELEEPQSSLAEPCLADHVQLGCPENVQLGSAEHKLLFRAVLEEVSGCREASNKLRRTFKTKTPGQAHQLESVNVQVDQAFAKAAALSEGIHPELLTPPVHYRQWQPHSALERLRVTTNKRKATAASKRSLASASGHSTPAMRPHAGGTLQHEIKKLDSSIRPTRASVKTPEQIERNKAFKAEAAEKRTRDKADPPYHPGSDFQPDKLVDRERLSRERERLSAGHKVIAEISTPGVVRFLPALEYDDAQLREHCVSNVHSRGARQCFDMCLVPCTNAAFSVEFVAIPGDMAYLKSLQDFVAGDDVLQARHVVYYANRTMSDHKITLIKSW